MLSMCDLKLFDIPTFLGCSISGCVECQDRNFVCEECNDDLEPTLDQYECACKSLNCRKHTENKMVNKHCSLPNMLSHITYTRMHSTNFERIHSMLVFPRQLFHTYYDYFFKLFSFSAMLLL